jgi:RNA polymerase sigma-19 factor, ECF subfamily
VRRLRDGSTNGATAAAERQSSGRELIWELCAGDTGALEKVLQRHWSNLVAYASSIVANRDAAEDVVQEAFVRLWERRLSWAPTAPVRPLLYRMTRNLALNERRRTDVRTRFAMRFGNPEDPLRADGPGYHLESIELRMAVTQAMNALPPRRREVFILARFHDMSYREIADQLGISIQTVANQVSAAMSQLERALEPFLCGDWSTKTSPTLKTHESAKRMTSKPLEGKAANLGSGRAG